MIPKMPLRTRDGRLREKIRKLSAQLASLKTENRLCETQRDEYRAVIHNAGEAFFKMDGNLKIVEVNPAFVALSQRDAKALLGCHPWQFFDEQTRRFLIRHRRKFIRQDQRHFRAGLVKPDQTVVPVMVHGSTLRDGKGAIVGHFVLLTDLTEHHSAMEMAFVVQKSLLPKWHPAIPGLDLAVKFVPAHGVSGDYYDFFTTTGDKNRLHLLVGDVSGHGLEAGLLMATARSQLRMRANSPGSILDIVSDVNIAIYNDFSEGARFITLFYCILDTCEWTLTWVRAGHDSPLLHRDASGTLERLGGRGIPLGVDPGYVFETRTTRLQPGDMLFLFTDGLREAEGITPAGPQRFGWQGIEAVLKTRGSSSPASLIRTMCRSMREFTQYNPLEDDVTVLALTRNRAGESCKGGDSVRVQC